MNCLSDSNKIKNNIKTARTNVIKAFHKFVFHNEGDRKNRKRLREFEGFDYDSEHENYNVKMQYVEENLSVADLVSICNLLELDYNTDDLKPRIFVNLIKGNLLKESTIEEEEQELLYLDNVGDTERENDKVVNGNNEKFIADKSKSIDMYDNDSGDESIADTALMQGASVTSSIVEKYMPRFAISFNDVEDSIKPFYGDETYPIEMWINEFEEISTLMNWNELQKLIFAKKSLKGLAKLYIQSETGITCWKNLKLSLENEFKTTFNSAKVHKLLTERKLRKNETIFEYFLKMKELANRGKIEDAALIQYVIDGIQESPINKTILYGAKTIKDFKEKLKLFELIQEKNKKSEVKKFEQKNDRLNRNKDDKVTYQTPRRCYNCGEIGHTSRFCSEKSKGTKCFKCNAFGHIASKCEINEKTQVRSNINCINFLNDDIARKEIIINKNKIIALIDTGSKFNIMTQNAYDSIGGPQLYETNTYLVGFGKNKEENKIKPAGCFESEIEIDRKSFYLKFYVVSSDCLDIQVIIGKDICKQAEITINSRGITVKKVDNEEDNKDFWNIMKIDAVMEEIDLDNDVDQEMKKTVTEMITSYLPEKTKTTNIEMNIILTNDTPLYHQPRRLPFKEREFVEHQIEQWLKEDIIEPCSSEYSSQVVVTKKKDGSSRLCIDYRKINKVIIKDRYPLPLIEDQLDQLQDAQVFSTIDLKNGFFHVKLKDECKKYTSFVTHNGQYQFKKVPFGLCNSPAVFQRFINCIFRELSNKGIALSYLDDVIIPAKNYDEAVERLKQVLEVAKEYGLEINKKKCQFLKKKVEFLGHVIENGNISPSPLKTAAVSKFPRPTTLKQLHSFLGLTGYFRKFIPAYAQIAKPLTDMLKKNIKFQFTDVEEKAFKTLKRLLSEKPILAIYNQKYETELHTDASIDGYGAILLQKSPTDLQLHPVYYMSRKTTDQERKYSSYELEVLAIIEAIKKFRVYLLGIKFKIVTDCNAFKGTLQKKDLTTRVARWVMLLEEFNYSIEHRSGTAMRHVDALSRSPIYLIEDGLISRIRKAQAEDDELKIIKEILQDKPYEDYFLKDNILHKFIDGQELLVIPRAMQAEIIRMAHERGHFAVRKTKDLICKDYFISKLKEKIERCIANCVVCILNNRKRGKQEGELHPIVKESIPLHTYHIDFLGPLESTNKNYNHIFTVIDSFTKFVWLYPTKSTSSKDAISKLDMQKKIFGNPVQIISDRGAAFTSYEFKDYCCQENIKHIKITTGLPRANGQAERLNSVVISVLSKMSTEDAAKWYKHVDNVQQVINSTYHRSIDTTPFELLTGVKMRNKDDILLKELIENEIITSFNNDRDDLRRNAKKQILDIQSENKRSYNLRRKKAVKYKLGDLVAIKRTQFGGGLKLKSKFLGPYQVVKVKSNDTYDLRKDSVSEGPITTTSCAEYMKLWRTEDDIELEEFGTNSIQDGRVVGTEEK